MGRCERCRAEFVSGASYGGHDYCMTCYAKARQEDEAKRQQAEQYRQDKIECRKQQLRKEYAAQDRERDKLKREAAEENKRQDIFDEKKRREDQMEEMRKRTKWGLFYLGKNRAVGEERQVFTPLDRKKKPVAAQEPPVSDGGRATLAAMVRRKPGAAKNGKSPAAPAQQALELSAKSGLPSSLTPGQGATAVLLGRNTSASPLTVSLLLTATDSLQGAMSAKPEPRTCTIAPGESAEFQVSLSVPQGAAAGKALLSAILKENAVYIDRQSAQSNRLELDFRIKG